MLITTEQLQNFSGVYNDDTSLSEIYIGAAEQTIKDYVGFDPTEREDWYKPETKRVTVYKLDDKFYEDEEHTKEVTIPEGAELHQVGDTDEYWYEVEVSVFAPPEVFRFVCLEIATLMQAEEGSNIGVNTQNDVGVSRTFLNVVDYSKYLARLSSYRIIEGM